MTEPKIDPTKTYQWQSSEEFLLQGGTLDLLKKVLMIDLDSADAQLVIAKYEALKAIDGIIAKGVEQGKVVEVKQESPSPTEFPTGPGN